MAKCKQFFIFSEGRSVLRTKRGDYAYARYTNVTFQDRSSMERAKVIEPRFSTADAEFPNINMDEGDLVLSFKDWQENQREVFFSDTVAFKWQMIETFIDGEEYDRSHLITESEWLAEHVKQGEIGAQEEYKHYKFNFNGNGQLEVISNGFVVKM